MLFKGQWGDSRTGRIYITEAAALWASLEIAEPCKVLLHTTHSHSGNSWAASTCQCPMKSLQPSSEQRGWALGRLRIGVRSLSQLWFLVQTVIDRLEEGAHQHSLISYLVPEIQRLYWAS